MAAAVGHTKHPRSKVGNAVADFLPYNAYSLYNEPIIIIL